MFRIRLKLTFFWVFIFFMILQKRSEKNVEVQIMDGKFDCEFLYYQNRSIKTVKTEYFGLKNDIWANTDA